MPVPPWKWCKRPKEFYRRPWANANKYKAHFPIFQADDNQAARRVLPIQFDIFQTPQHDCRSGLLREISVKIQACLFDIFLV